MRLVAALGSRPVTLDTLPLLQDTAEHDTDGEEEESGSNACWWIVVLYPATTVGAVVPAIIINLLLLVLVCIVYIWQPVTHDMT